MVAIEEWRGITRGNAKDPPTLDVHELVCVRHAEISNHLTADSSMMQPALAMKSAHDPHLMSVQGEVLACRRWEGDLVFVCGTFISLLPLSHICGTMSMLENQGEGLRGVRGGVNTYVLSS